MCDALHLAVLHPRGLVSADAYPDFSRTSLSQLVNGLQERSDFVLVGALPSIEPFGQIKVLGVRRNIVR